jgi:hypothetical protein
MTWTWRYTGIAAAVAAGALALAPAARADNNWNEGVYQSTTYTQCVVDVTEVGADAWAGYQADPNNPPKPGDVFYGHAVFGAATSACNGDMAAEVDVVLPPGVSLAIDSDHPIFCLYNDPDGPVVQNPTCPTRTVPGAYGPTFLDKDGGSAWDLPPGRTFQIAFPLRTTRQLEGPAGGNCPQSVDDLPFYTQYDCLIAAVHIIDGDTDPWLAPDVQMFTGAASVPPPHTTNNTLALSLPKGQKLRAIKKLHVACTANAAGACKVTATITARQARKLHLKVAKTMKLGSASGTLSGAGTANLSIKLAKKVATALHHADSVKLALAAVDTDGATAAKAATLRH